MRLALVALAVLVLAGAASAATTRKVPQDYETIQDAVDAADDGDTILVSKRADGKPYEERIVTGKSLKFVGKKVVWDGHDGEGGYGTCLTVTGESPVPDVVVQGFVFRNGQSHVYVYGTDTLVQSCTFRGAYGTALFIEGEDSRVLKCVFRGNNRGAEISAPGSVLDRNEATGHGNGGLFAYGEDVVMSRNRCSRSIEGDGIRVYGHGALITGNTVTLSAQAIHVQGDDGRIEKNRVSRTYGIEVQGRGTAIVGNSILQTDGPGISVEGEEGSSESPTVIEGNQVRSAEGYGIEARNWPTEIRGNTVASTGSSGIHVQWQVDDSAIVVEDNSVAGTYDNGIFALGGGAVVARNTIRGAGNSGIGVEYQDSGDPLLVRDNRVSECFGSGIHVTSSGTTWAVEGNAVADCLGASDSIVVYLLGGPAQGFMVRNTVTAPSTGGIYVYSPYADAPVEIQDNVVSGGGAAYDSGIYFQGQGSSISGNRVDDMIDAGILVFGNGGNEIANNVINRCDGVALFVIGEENVVTGNTGRGGDGEGYSNYGSATTFTGNSFLGFRLDVTNNGSFATLDIDAANEFETGGASVGAQYWIP